MLKTLKKSLFVSLFIFSSSIFSSALIIKRVTQAIVTRTLNQSTAFHSSRASLCPNIFAAVMAQLAAEKATEAETQAQAAQAMDTSTNNQQSNQSLTNDNPILLAVHKNRTIHYYEPLDPKSTLPNWHPCWPNQMIDDRISNNDSQSHQYMSEMITQANIEAAVNAIAAEKKSQLLKDISKLLTINQTATVLACTMFESVTTHGSCSNFELQKLHAKRNQDLLQLEKALESLSEQNDKVSLIINSEKHNWNLTLDSILRDGSVQNYREIKQALALQAAIKKIKSDIQAIDYTLKQREHAFESELRSKSLEEIQDNVIPKIITEKEANDISITGKQKKINTLNKEIKILETELKSYTNSWLGAKSWRWISGNEIQKILNDKLDEAYTKKEQLNKELQLVHDQQQEIKTKVEQAYKILLEKQQAQKVKLAQHNQEQETFISSEQCVQNQYDACSFDLEKCPDPGLEQAWADRQDALCNTIEQGYAQFDQEFDLTPELFSFLTAHDIDPKEFQNFYGTSLQQQLHKEMCAILSQTAQLESKFPYQSNLINNIVNVADAAHDANKNGNVLLASRLIDVDSLLLKISHEIFTVAMPYAQAATSGLIHSVQDFIHTVAHPIETAQNLGKAIYYVLETAALNCYDEVDGFEDIYIPLRDQRNAEIIEGLKNLGEHMTNASGPEKFEALVRFGADFFIPGKIISAVGGVCDVIKAEANIENTAKLVAGANEQATIVKNSEHVAKTVEKIEALTQKKITQSVAKNLLDAEQNFDKTATSSIKQKIKRASDAPPAVDMRSLLDKNLEIVESVSQEAVRKTHLPDGRVRYYKAEQPSMHPGPTRGFSYVLEHDSSKGIIRGWYEGYTHDGIINRVHPKMINGKEIFSLHYPHTKKELEIIAQLVKGKK